MSAERRRLSLDTLARDSALARDLSPGERASLLVQCASVLTALAVDLVEAPAAGPDRLLTVKEVVELTGLSADFLYRRRASTLPFSVEITGSRVRRFSAAKLARWMEDGRPG